MLERLPSEIVQVRCCTKRGGAGRGTAHQTPEMAPTRRLMLTVWTKGEPHPRPDHTSENETKWKSYGLFCYGVFHVMFLSSGWLLGSWNPGEQKQG